MIKPASSAPLVPTVTFWGAAQSVTGSMHLVEVGGERILLDCGRARSRRKRARTAEPDFPFAPSSIDAVVLSHAHLDHCGNLPALVRQGFAGPIHCTPATRDLIAITLSDSARFQAEDLRLLRVAQPGAPNPSAADILRSSVDQVLEQCEPLDYGQSARITSQAELQLLDAGHVLGSAMALLTFASASGRVTISFTGDLGRSGLPYLHPASAMPDADLLICESTYGGRSHQSLEQMAAQMAAAVKRTADEGGTVLIPAFSMGRTQIVAHYLETWIDAGLLPDLPIFIDSPLAAELAEVHDRYPECFMKREARAHSGAAARARYVRSREESNELAQREEPCLLIASGGTCDGGRVVKHLRKRIDDPRSSLMLVGFQPPGSLGEQLLQQRPTVYFDGRTWNKWIEVVAVNGFSGHADHQDFLTRLRPLLGRTSQICLVHGEIEQSRALADGLEQLGFNDVRIPAPKDVVAVA